MPSRSGSSGGISISLKEEANFTPFSGASLLPLSTSVNEAILSARFLCRTDNSLANSDLFRPLVSAASRSVLSLICFSIPAISFLTVSGSSFFSSSMTGNSSPFSGTS